MADHPIPPKGQVECSKCGEKTTVEIASRTGYARCACGNCLGYGQNRATWVEVFSLFGLDLSVDFDGQLIVASETEPSRDVLKWLFHHQGQLREAIENAGRDSRRVFVGGSRNGERHGTPFRNGDRVHIHIGRADWETYEYRGHTDPRLFFVGRARSRAKARKALFVKSGENA